MKEKIVTRLVEKFTSAKFLIAIMVMATLCYLAIAGRIEPKDFLIIASMVASAYYVQSVAKGSTPK